ncbi:hypothetical protein VM98_00885 [Streptomyces rubellomurinus subsp. indigoferus]|nr:hypothetical protein VM98_00885 [Streptomyces rubellomurinus subsp. indigoferus]
MSPVDAAPAISPVDAVPSAPPPYGPPPGAPGFPPPPGMPGAPGFPPPPGAPGFVPGPGAGYPAPGAPSLGNWGAGRPVQPRVGQPPLLRWLTGSDWRPALVSAIAPTVVLLVAALAVAAPADYRPDGAGSTPGFGDVFGATLGAALGALGAPLRIGYHGNTGFGTGMDYEIRALPLTVTLLWILALWLGLRAGLRRSKAKGVQLTRGQAAGEALRSALVMGAVTLLLGLVAGTTWKPDQRGRGGFSGYDYGDYGDYGSGPGSGGKRDAGMSFFANTGWAEALGWTVLLAFLVAFAVYGTDALRWAAWRSPAVRGWAVSALTAGQALALTWGLASVAGFVIAAANSDNGWEVGAAFAFMPNLGLALLGFGSGASLQGDSVRGGYDSSMRGSGPDSMDVSFFDLHELGGEWRLAGLLALVSAAVLAGVAVRRRLGSADRLRLAAVYAAALVLLSTVGGAIVTMSITMAGWSSASRSTMSQEMSIGLSFPSVLLASIVWAAVGALVVPALLTGFRRGGAQPYPAPPYYAGAPGYPGGPGFAGAPVPPQPPYPGGPDLLGAPGFVGAPVPPQPPYPGAPAYGAPVPPPAQAPAPYGVPHPAAAPDPHAPSAPPVAAPAAPAGGVGEVLGSHEPAPAPATPPSGEAPVDPSVWRDHP